MKPEYVFSDNTQRSELEYCDIVEFAEDPYLGREQDVTVLVKWTNQTYHDENLRSMFSDEWDSVRGISKRNVGRHRNQYYAGLLVSCSLGVDFIDAKSACDVESAIQPTGIDMQPDGAFAIAVGEKIFLSTSANLAQAYTEITRDDFARLHSVEFNRDGDRLLTSSSSLDLVQEISLEGELTWSMDMWDTPYNTNGLGQRFYREVGRVGLNKYLLNTTPDDLKSIGGSQEVHCVLDSPNAYNNLGLPTNLTPVFPNTASYGYENDVLITTFHRGEAWKLNRDTNHIEVVANNMKNPHGFHIDRLHQGYVVTDTGNEVVRYVSVDMTKEKIIDFSKLHDRKPGLERVRWLQYTNFLAESVYCAVISPRQCLTLFDPIAKTKRDIPFDNEWGIQQVKSFQRI